MTDTTYCCKFMREQLTYECGQHGGTDCPDVIVKRTSDGSLMLKGRCADYVCNFCPYCGTADGQHSILSRSDNTPGNPTTQNGVQR